MHSAYRASTPDSSVRMRIAASTGTQTLSVSDLASLRRTYDGLDRAIDDAIVHHSLDHRLREKVHSILTSTVDLRVPFLPTKALHLSSSQAGHTDLRESLLHVLELKGFNDGFDQFHILRMVGGLLRARTEATDMLPHQTRSPSKI